jgi:uncharacterized membrane protein (UPF0127 family)
MKTFSLALIAVLAAPAFADIAPWPGRPAKRIRPEAEACRPQRGLKKVSVKLPGGKTIKADVADSVLKREKGLMCVTKMPKDYGMLFAFPGEQPLNFWMKNTLVPLDIVFIGADKKITAIAESLKASTTETPDAEVATASGRGLFVLELAAGESKRRKLKAGMALDFDVALPKE